MKFIKVIKKHTSAHLSAEIASYSVSSHYCDRESGRLQLKNPIFRRYISTIKKKITLGTSHIWGHLKITTKADKADAAQSRAAPCPALDFSD